jgi:hypothetical protein
MSNYAPLKYECGDLRSEINFDYFGNDNDYLDTLKGETGLGEYFWNLENNLAKVLFLMDWVHKQWKHNGVNEPEFPDPLSILRETKAVKNFRCVEYSVLLQGCLASTGIKARVLSMRSKDVETRKSGAGHKVVECFLTDQKKWVLMDPQFGYYSLYNGNPVSALGLQVLLSRDPQNLKLFDKNEVVGKEKKRYYNYVSNYLYYFIIDPVQLPAEAFPYRSSPRSKLILKPVDAKTPTRFQRLDLKEELIPVNIKTFYGDCA